jgi:5'-phosphate synthase pdxT subunit
MWQKKFVLHSDSAAVCPHSALSTMGVDKNLPTVGVLALQGAFQEHIHLLSQLRPQPPTLAVRTTDDLARCDALIIPGGESTTMSLLAQRTGLLEPLRSFVRDGKPVWGTCAGMILLADEVVGGSAKQGGQEGIGGIGIRVVRNQWGRQVKKENIVGKRRL